MSKETDVPIKDHEYDGIQEFDNPLPMWWLITFYGTVIFGFFYWVYYTFGGGPTQLAYLKENMAEVTSLQAKNPTGGETDEALARLLQSNEALAKGASVFAEKCGGLPWQ